MKASSPVQLLDTSLRDGNHAVGHSISRDQIRRYAEAADAAGIDMIECGHGNGLGASSLQVGRSSEADGEMLAAAREAVTRGRLVTLALAGFATRKRDIAPALASGVDVVRLGAHCTEADLSVPHIDFVRSQGCEAHGVLMMAHWAPVEVLCEQARLMVDAGAQAIILMDSAGALTPGSVSDRVTSMSESIGVPIGFHAHNNLHLAVANAIAAVSAGATILDGSARGFGAGAGNAAIEVLAATMDHLGIPWNGDIYGVLDAAEYAVEHLVPAVPHTDSLTIISGRSGVFSGFAPHVRRAATSYSVDPRDVLSELGRRRVVAGQEDVVVDVALGLAEEPTLEEEVVSSGDKWHS
jgi:4-hydroxy 2-oxovalerate aldolase